MNEYRPAIRYGVIMGIVQLLIFLVFYAIDPYFFATIKGGLINFAIGFIALPIVFMILAARDTKANFTRFPFGKAFNAAFFTAIVSVLIMLVFNLIFNTVIDPDYQKNFQNASLENQLELMESQGVDEATLEEVETKARERVDNQSMGPVAMQLMGSGVMLAWMAFLALIVGAVQKHSKRELEEMTDVTDIKGATEEE